MNEFEFSIPTRYNDILFRSRLEARWAVYFDTIGLKWFYEFEGFILPNGKKYLPDFYIPNFGYIEIKAKGMIKPHEIEKCVLLSKITDKEVMLCEGAPALIEQKVYQSGEERCGAIFCFYSVRKWQHVPYFGPYPFNEEDETDPDVQAIKLANKYVFDWENVQK